MADLSFDAMKFPNEILLKIFSHIDHSSLNTVGQVCHKWRDVVQMIHDKAWKSVTRAVLLKREIIGTKYESRGWIEEVHSMDQCKCIKIARDLFIYDDDELLNSDLELAYEFDILTNPKLSEIQAASRLAAAGILANMKDVNLSKIKLQSVKHLRHLVSIVKDRLVLTLTSYKDLINIVRYIDCKELQIYDFWQTINYLDRSESISVTRVLESSVEEVCIKVGCEGKGMYHYIRDYEGNGKCKKITFHFDFQKCRYIDLHNILKWSEDRDWLWQRWGPTRTKYPMIVYLERK